MSTVMRPRGPLPARVYWTRRLLLIVGLVIFVAVAWYLIPGGGGPGAASANPGVHHTPGPSATTGHRSTPTTPTRPSRPVHSTPHQTSRSKGAHPTQHQPTTPVTTTTPPPEPTGVCDPAKLTLSVEVGRAVEGQGARVRLSMATTDGSTCSLGLTPSGLEIEITSGPATIWHSTSCPDGLPAKNVVVQPRAEVVYSIHWDGHIDSNACRTGWRTADPGGYWVTAALVGGEPDRTYFAVVPAHSGT